MLRRSFGAFHTDDVQLELGDEFPDRWSEGPVLVRLESFGVEPVENVLAAEPFPPSSEIPADLQRPVGPFSMSVILGAGLAIFGSALTFRGPIELWFVEKRHVVSCR